MRTKIQSVRLLALTVLITMEILLGGVLSPSMATAATYYVALTGNDGNTCAQAQSISTPKRTVRNAQGCLAAGDTLYLRAGTYAEDIQGVPSGTSWTNAVTVAAYPGETVVIKPTEREVLWTLGQYQIYDHLIFDGSNSAQSAVYIDASAHHIRIQNGEILNAFSNCVLEIEGTHHNEYLNLKVHACGTRDPTYAPGHNAFYLQGDYNLVDHCEVYDSQGGIYAWNSQGGTSDFNIFRNNLIHHVGDTIMPNHIGALGLTNGTGNVAYNNILYANEGAIQVGLGEFDAKVYNNTVYNNKQWGILIGGSVNALIKNNIFALNTTDIWLVTDQAVGTVFSNNLCEKSQTGCNVVGDPKLANASASDFHLQSGSPAIDTGATLAEVPNDYDRVVRPQGATYDIGAYEYTLTAPPASPTNLRITQN